MAADSSRLSQFQESGGERRIENREVSLLGTQMAFVSSPPQNDGTSLKSFLTKNRYAALAGCLLLELCAVCLSLSCLKISRTTLVFFIIHDVPMSTGDSVRVRKLFRST